LFSLPNEALSFLYDRTLAAPALGLALKCLPFSFLILWLAFRSIPRSVLEAASSDGAGPIAQLVRVVLPQRKLAAGAAWLVPFGVALGDLGVSLLLLPPGIFTLSTRVFDRLHSGADEQVAGICLFVILVSYLAWLPVAIWVGRRSVHAMGRTETS
jgi:iron(III) transport system permease protein